MSKYQASGSNQQDKGKIKRIWGVLIDDDFKKGSLGKRHGSVQQPIGDTKVQIDEVDLLRLD